MTDQSQWKPLSPAFNDAVRRYDRSSRVRLDSLETRNAVRAPLYHYTDRKGFEGIVNTQEIWYTQYQHLNDDKEFQFGLDLAKGLLAEFGRRSPNVKIFCDMVCGFLSNDRFQNVFDFYVASFSRDADSEHMWKKYADHGKGVAMGFAPSNFATGDKPHRRPHENVFVAPVQYGASAGRAYHLPGIKNACQIVAEISKRKSLAMSDRNIGMPFFDELGKALMATELIFKSLAIKHEDWSVENEVRLFIVGESKILSLCNDTRVRNGESIPFIKGSMPIRQPGKITEIVIGTDAPHDFERFVYSLLKPFHDDSSLIVRRSRVRVL